MILINYPFILLINSINLTLDLKDLTYQECYKIVEKKFLWEKQVNYSNRLLIQIIKQDLNHQKSQKEIKLFNLII
jgi:hypothetical protein